MSKKDRRATGSGPDKVIHVIFGPGGGRTDGAQSGAKSGPDGDPRTAASARAQSKDGANATVAPPPPVREPVSDLFTATEVSKLLGVSQGRLRSLDRARIVSPSGRRRGHRAYTFQDIIALRAARDLLAKKVRLRDVSRAVDNIRASLPKVTRPLSELRIVSDGKRVVVKSPAFTYEPLTGQLVLDFDIKALHDDVVRVLRPPVGRERARSAYELYVRASRLDEDPDTIDEAERLYEEAVALDPWLAIAYTNLGNIRFRRGDVEAAETLYRKALSLESAQPEAQYNLGYVMLDRGEASDSIGYFQGAIASDPQFADAYFNLAMAFEQSGQPEKARPNWRKYLDLEPTGTWAEIARRHL